MYTVRKNLIDMLKVAVLLTFVLKVNHSALYMKLMKRHAPVELLRLLESWLSDCFACVKWNNSWSCVFKLSSGVRQVGLSVLSPYMFAV